MWQYFCKEDENLEALLISQDTMDLVEFVTSSVITITSIIVTILIALISFKMKKTAKEKEIINFCTYDFLIPFIKPFRETYKYFFKENVSSTVVIDSAYVKISEKRCTDVINNMKKNNVSSDFPYFSQNVSCVFSKAFPQDTYLIYDFICKAKEIEQIQSEIISSLENYISESTLSEATIENYICDKSKEINIKATLVKVHEMNRAINNLPTVMDINNKLSEINGNG